MGWFAIIMAIVQAIPTIIKLIEMLRDLMKNRSKEEKKIVGARLKGILARWRENRDSKQAAAEVEALIREVQ